MSRHTLSVLVENKPGVLARIAGLFCRRGFNIDSLAVGPTEHPEVSRMTIVVNVEELPAGAGHQAAEQAGRGDQDRRARRRRLRLRASCCWSRSRPTPATRGQVLEVVQLFRAKVVDVGTDAITIQVTGNPDKLADFLRIVEPFGVRELVQSGMVAIGRGSRSISERTLRPVAVPAPAAAG